MAMVDEDRPLFENAEWCVTSDGLEHRRTGYFIDRADLDQRRDGDLWAWPLHMAEKSWCDMAPFMEAFGRAAQLYGLETGPGLTRSFAVAAHDIASWPDALRHSQEAVRTVENLLKNAVQTPISMEPDTAERQTGANVRKGPVHHAYRVHQKHRNPRSPRGPNGCFRTHASNPALPGRARIGTRLVRLLQTD
jgi:hypothetical protein